ncbi:MAG: HEAT repeat domain-containing protein [Nitrospirota bacterium]|nr:HEAT repeat domain-containing protein [Nitrospirota bacterium]
MPTQPPTEQPEGTVQAPGEQPGEQQDAAVLRAARDLLTHVSRSLKTMRLYSSTNTMYQRALEDAARRLSNHVGEHGSLVLRIERERMLLGGEVAFQDDDPKDGLVFHLYSDGLRGLTVHSGMDEEEARAALRILAKGASLGSGEDDDVVTLLWNGEFTHLLMDVVEDDAASEELAPTMEVKKPEERHERLQQVVQAQQAAPEPPKTVAYGADVLKVFNLTDRDQAYLDDLVRREQELDPAQDLVSILSDVLVIEADADEFSDTVALFGRLVIDFLTQGNLALAAALGRGLVACAAARKDLAPPMKERLMQELLGFGTGRPMAALEAGIRLLFGGGGVDASATTHAQRETAMTALGSYLTLLRRTDIRQFLEMISRVPDGHVRDLMCDHAARLAPESHEVLTGMLLDLDAALVQCVAEVLGRVGNGTDLPHYNILSKHGDVNVRRTALEAIISIAGGAHPQIVAYLVDPDPRLRRRALAVAEAGRLPEALELLRQIAVDPGFTAWELVERRAVFAAIGIIGGDQVVPMLGEYMHRVKRGLFGGAKGEDDALLAVVGLRAAATDAALKLLEEGSKSRSDKVSAACQTALKELATRGGRT